MKRLTKPGFDFTSDFVASSLQSFPIAEALKRLQRYEDTGVEPEEMELIIDQYGRGFTAKTAFMEELQAYRAIGTVEEFRTLKDAEQKRREGGPCDLCRFSPPSSCDGKPCTMCPAS